MIGKTLAKRPDVLRPLVYGVKKMRLKTLIGLSFIISLVLTERICANDGETKNRNTVYVTGIIIPAFIFYYNFGAGYDFYLSNPHSSFAISANAAIRSGYSVGAPGTDKISSSGRFVRTDFGGKIWWHTESSDTLFGFFLGLSAAYVRSAVHLKYEVSKTEPIVEIASPTFNRVLPGYTLGGMFKRKGSCWSFGFAIGGLMASTVTTTYQLPSAGDLQTKDLNLGSAFFFEALIGYSF